MNADPKDPRLLAMIKFFPRTGATDVGIRFSDDEQPVIWVAVGTWKGGAQEAAGALDPVTALARLAELVVDGSTCSHCGKPTGFSPDWDEMPLQGHVCWYQYDPETQSIRRGCESD